jgi:two-component system sensor histidine kinase BarA
MLPVCSASQHLAGSAERQTLAFRASPARAEGRVWSCCRAADGIVLTTQDQAQVFHRGSPAGPWTAPYSKACRMLAKLFRQRSSDAPPETDPVQRCWSRTEALSLAGVLLLLTLVWSAVVLQSKRDVRQVEAGAIRELHNLCLAFAESSASRLQSVDQAIRLVRREAQRRGASFALAGAAEFSELIDASLSQIAIIGSNGFLSDSSLPFSRIDLSDRQHFRVHQQASDDRFFISPPVLGRVSNRWTLQATRRITTVGGGFGGVVVISLASDRLTNFYSSLDLGAQGVMTLVGRDGWIRAQRSAGDKPVVQDIGQSLVVQAALKAPVGSVWVVSPGDPVERLYAFRTLDQYDLIAFVGRSRDDIMSGVYQLRRIYVGMAGLFTMLLLGLSALLLRRVRQQSALVEDLRLSRLSADTANEMKSRFLASVSHELRTPLNGILGYAELMLEPVSASETQEYAQVIHASGQQLHRLVNTMLDLARLESGRMGACFADSNLTQMLDEACEPYRTNVQSRQLTLQVSVDERCPDEIRTDRVRLLQALDCLIHNAVKFTERGGVRVAAYCKSQVLTIEVSDTGMGISAAQMAQVFARFEAPPLALIHPGQGAGLGLPLAKELTELIGGVLLIDSTPTNGTRATIMLPLRPPLATDTQGRKQ